MQKTVDDLKVGETGIIKKFHIKGSIGKRLREMGLTKGVTVKLERKAPLGYPVEIRVRGFSLALRKNEAQTIILES